MLTNVRPEMNHASMVKVDQLIDQIRSSQECFSDTTQMQVHNDGDHDIQSNEEMGSPGEPSLYKSKSQAELGDTPYSVKVLSRQGI